MQFHMHIPYGGRYSLSHQVSTNAAANAFSMPRGPATAAVAIARLLHEPHCLPVLGGRGSAGRGGARGGAGLAAWLWAAGQGQVLGRGFPGAHSPGGGRPELKGR